jgi:hypothetical protein
MSEYLDEFVSGAYESERFARPAAQIEGGAYEGSRFNRSRHRKESGRITLEAISRPELGLLPSRVPASIPQEDIPGFQEYLSNGGAEAHAA